MKTFSMVKNVFRFDNRIEGFNENHLLLLVYLQKFTTFQGKIYFIFNFMFSDLNINKYPLQKQLYQCLQDLQKWGLINITNKVDFESINKNTIIILDGVQYENNYTMLITDEIDKILYSDEDIRVKKTMLYIYTLIVSRIDEKGFCFPRRETFKKDMQIKSNKRVQDAIDKLKELNLIDYAKAGIIRDKKGRIYNANNIYVTTYTKNYKEILESAVNINREYHEENNSIVMQKKKKEDLSIAKEEIEEKSNIEIDEKILNFDYENDYAQMILKHLKKGLKNNEDVSSIYERLKRCYEEEVEHKERVRATKEKRSLLQENNNSIVMQKKKKEDNSLDWVKEVEEREKFYSEFENNKEEKTILEVLNENKDCEKYELPF